MDWLGQADSKMVRHYYHLHDKESQRHIRRVKLFEAADVRPSTVHDENGGASPQRHAASSSTILPK